MVSTASLIACDYIEIQIQKVLDCRFQVGSSSQLIFLPNWALMLRYHMVLVESL